MREKIYDPCELILHVRELKTDRICTSGCCPRMSAHEIEQVTVNHISHCPQVSGRFQSIDGSDDVVILFSNDESTGVGVGV